MKTLPCFFAPPENVSADQVVIRGSDATHIRVVLRLKPGDDIHVLDGKGGRFRVRLRDVRPKEAAGQIVSREKIQTESPLAIKLGQAIIKGNKFDGVVRKSVELGVHSIVPLHTERTVIKVSPEDQEKKTRRWRRIALEASKQCGRSAVPSVEASILSVDQFCAGSDDLELKLVFWEDEERVRLKDMAALKFPDGAPPACGIACLIGPEGGFTQTEIETARARGFQCVTLGPRKLRSETAAIAALSIIQSFWGDL